MNNFNFGNGMGTTEWLHVYAPIFAVLALWTIFWKGLALWHSAKRGQSVWFIILLIVNTVGILEIIYLFAVLKLKAKDLLQK